MQVDASLDLSADVEAALPRSSGLFWDGMWQSPSHLAERDSVNPSTGKVLRTYFDCGLSEVNAAVSSAKAAFSGWSKTPPLQRAACLKEAATRIRHNALELALIDAADCGNPVKAMVYDAEVAALQLEYFAGLVLEIKGETLPTANGALNYTMRQPLGVVGRILAFNHPFMFAAGKIAAPLAAGNTVVIKPPEQASLSTIRLLELLQDVFPPGVLNCVTGGRETGAALASHPDVAAIGIIGSVGAGKAVARSAADTLKHTLLELGGKNAMIVFPDCDFDRAVEGAVRGMNFTWCGQSCGSTSRLFVHDELHDRFVDALIKTIARAHCAGIATDMRTTMGALVSQSQHERCLDYIKSARHAGASLVYGGKRPDDPLLAGGFFLEPTVFTDVSSQMRIAREEIFGPVLSIIRWSDANAMLADVNGLDVGLTASIWTQNVSTAHRFAESVEAGYVWVNDAGPHILGAPFGGYKQSGIGREESKEELMEFTRIKNVNVRLHG